jgi:hypothetical protein
MQFGAVQLIVCVLCQHGMQSATDGGPASKVFKFDFSTMPPYGITLYVGGTESGKSSGMVETMYWQRDLYDVCIIMCDSVDDVMKYEKIAPGAFVFEGYHPEVIERFYAIQQRNTRRGIKSSVLLVVDDCGFDDKTMRNDKQLKRLASNGRHARIRTLLAIQDVTQLAPAVRKGAKHVVLAKEKRPPYKRRLYEYLNPCFKSFEEFEAVFDAVAQDNRQMVMYMFQGSTSNEIVDNVWWFKPSWPWRDFKIPSPERLGSQAAALWRFHKSWIRQPPPAVATGLKQPQSAIIKALRSTNGGGPRKVTKRTAPPPPPPRLYAGTMNEEAKRRRVVAPPQWKRAPPPLPLQSTAKRRKIS